MRVYRYFNLNTGEEHGTIHDYGEVQLWECPSCGFAFDAVHEDDEIGGGYSCPECAQVGATKEGQKSDG